MSRRLLLWLCLDLFFFIRATPLCAQQVGDTVFVTAASEAKLQVNAHVVAQVARGTPLVIEEVDKSGFRVTWRGMNGWIARGDVLPIDKAVAFFTKSIAAEPHAADYVGCGCVRLCLHLEPDQTLADFEKAIQLDSNSCLAYCGRAAVRCARGNYKEAIDDCSKALKLDPNNAWVYGTTGYVHTEMAEFGQAASDYSIAIRLNPRNVNLYRYREYDYESAGDLKKAIADLDAIIRLRPDSPCDYEARGVLRIMQQDYKLGAADIQAAVRLNPNDQAVNFEPWGKLLLSAEDLRHGREMVEQMLKDRPVMGKFGKSADVLCQWAAHKFAGEDARERVFWDSSSTINTGSTAESIASSEDAPAFIRVQETYTEGPLRGKTRGFEEMWSGAVHELYNMMLSKAMQELAARAGSGAMSKEQYVRDAVLCESRSAERVRSFYIHVFLPWAERQRFPTNPAFGTWRNDRTRARI